MPPSSPAPVDAVLFFDACMPKISRCRDDCQNNKKIFCRHRFNFKTKIFHTNDYMDFTRFYDFQVILHCFYLIRNNKSCLRLAEKGRFFLITKDRTFLRDAEKEWKDRIKAKTQPKLSFNPKSVSCGQYVIKIIEVDCKNFGTDKHDDVECVVEEVNKQIRGEI